MICLSPLQGDISCHTNEERGGIMQLCMNGVHTLPVVGYTGSFHERWDGGRSVYLLYGLKSAVC